MVAFLLSCLCLTSASAYADWHIIDLNELSLDYKNYALVNDKARNLLIYPEHPKEGVDVTLNMDILSKGYLDSQIESLTTSAQYRSIGLQLRAGVRISEHLEFGYWHHSQHVLDRDVGYYDKFPSEDAVEIKLFIYRADKRDSIL